MPRFQLVYVGEEQELSFLCNRCALRTVEQSFDTYNRPFNQTLEAGYCHQCDGSGLKPGIPSEGICPECRGTGICADCEGKAIRMWEELPEAAREEWDRLWDIHGSWPSNHGAVISLHRRW